MFSGKLVPDIIGHIQRETSHRIWYAIVKGAAVTAHVTKTRPKRLSLIQGGLEILIIVTVKRDNPDSIRILKEKIEIVNIPVGEDEVYKDESETISKTSGTEEYKNNDCNMWRLFLLCL